MPAAHINLLEGHGRAELRRLIVEVSDVMASVLGAPKERLEVWVTEHDPELFGVNGAPAIDGLAPAPLRDVEIPLVLMTLLSGRPPEQHHALIAGITEVIERVLGTPAGRTRIGITTVSPDSWGIGGRPASVVRAGEIAARDSGARPGITS
jgi:4-oxalocrotonate tautomerase family enzyme